MSGGEDAKRRTARLTEVDGRLMAGLTFQAQIGQKFINFIDHLEDSMKLPKPTHANYRDLISDIRRGQIKIPQFQRDFVWSMQKSAVLMDSVIKGYPVGTFIFWVTKDRLPSVRNLGKQELPPPKDGEAVSFILDGQQRLTSLFATLNGLTIERESGQKDDFSKIYVDLDAEEDEQIVVMDTEGREGREFITLKDLLYGDVKLHASFLDCYHDKLSEYKTRIETYEFSVIEVQDASIDVATDIFTRINVGGTPLTLFQIMVAKTYDEGKCFDLAKKFEELISNLTPLNYETLSDATILQLISLLLCRDCKRQSILKLDKDKFIDTWPKAVDAIERAVEYFKFTYRIPVSRLLPYNTLLAPFGYFFFHHHDKPNSEQKKFLEDFFWRTSLGGRYSSGVESKLGQDIRRIDMILKNESSDYDWSIDISSKFILENGWFNAGRSFTKSILCLYAFQVPKSFKDNSLVNISNDWLKRANSKNYHHFFPRGYLGKQNAEIEEDKVNNIVNITIVDEYLNKKEIGKKPPSVYMQTFANENPDLSETMKTHLIMDLGEFGIWSDNYELFLDRRASAISRELESRIIPREIDEHGQRVRADDFEEEMVGFE